MNTNRGYFIAGTDTGVGKSLIAAAVLHLLRMSRHDAVGFKPVCSGREADGFWWDLELLYRFSDAAIDRRAICPYTLPEPRSPVAAARLAGTSVEPEILRNAYLLLKRSHAMTVCEGVGGIMVPLQENYLLLDFIAFTGLPVLLVARAGLGTINHSLLSLEVLKQRSIPLAGLILNTTTSADAAMAEDNLREIAGHAQLPWQIVVPFFERSERIETLETRKRHVLELAQYLENDFQSRIKSGAG